MEMNTAFLMSGSDTALRSSGRSVRNTGGNLGSFPTMSFCGSDPIFLKMSMVSATVSTLVFLIQAPLLGQQGDGKPDR